MPLFTLHCALHGAQRKIRGRVDRYSFLVRLFHPLLHAGLSRRTGYPLDSLNFQTVPLEICLPLRPML